MDKTEQLLRESLRSDENAKDVLMTLKKIVLNEYNVGTAAYCLHDTYICHERC